MPNLELDGFLGTRASLMMDVVAVALVVLLPTLAWSIWLVRSRRRYDLHRKVQLLLGGVLLITVVLFELDVRFGADWRARAAASPYYNSWVFYSLYIHLVFSVSTTLLWIIVTLRAVKNFPVPPLPGPHSAWHRRWAWIAAIDMVLTAITGWIFYWLAFVSKG